MVIAKQVKSEEKWLLLARREGSRNFLGCIYENIIGLANITHFPQPLLLTDGHIQ
jgi:hypothetical protein